MFPFRSSDRKLQFTKQEQEFLPHIIFPSNLQKGFEVIGGLESQIKELKELVINPLKYKSQVHDLIALEKSKQN